MSKLSILHISDTHGLHRQLPQLPDADMIVHSGDFTMAGTEQEAFDFINWFCDLPHRHKIFIAGNHDDCLYGTELSGLDDSCHYLCNSGVNIEGIKFYGVSMFMEDDMTGKYKEYLSDIPNDTDVLITHQPPAGVILFFLYCYRSCSLLYVLKITKVSRLTGYLQPYFSIIFLKMGILETDAKSFMQDLTLIALLPNIS